MIHLSHCAVEVEDLGKRTLYVGSAERKQRNGSRDRRSDDACQTAPDWIRHMGLVGHICSCMFADLIERLRLMERYWLVTVLPAIAAII
jgi:hypothetical protein